MTRKLIAAALWTAAAVATPALSATNVVDFNGLHNAGGGYTYVSGPYKEDGFTLTAGLCEPNAKFGPTCFVTQQSFNSIDPTGAALQTQYQSQRITVTRDNAALFSLSSIDFSENFDNLTYNPFFGIVNFTFTYADGSTGAETRSYSNDGKFVRNTVTLDTRPLLSFTFAPQGGIQFDNIVLQDVATAAVPEPASWAMMLVGFGAVGSALRRRRVAVRPNALG